MGLISDFDIPRNPSDILVIRQQYVAILNSYGERRGSSLVSRFGFGWAWKLLCLYRACSKQLTALETHWPTVVHEVTDTVNLRRNELSNCSAVKLVS